MQRQEIKTIDGKDYLIVCLPTLPELLTYGFVSASKKSFVFRKWETGAKDTMSCYKNIKLNLDLIKGRIIISGNHYHTKDVIDYEFQSLKNFILPAIKISISKI